MRPLKPETPEDELDSILPYSAEDHGEFQTTMPHAGAQGVYADTVIDAAEDALRFLVTAELDDSVLALLRAQGEVRMQPDLPKQPGVFKRSLANTDALIIESSTTIDNETLQDCRRLKVIACLEYGHQNIDTEACKRRGIQVITAPESSAQSVAEYVISAAFTLRRKLFITPALSQATQAGQWPRQTAGEGRELFGATLGLMGFQDMASQRVAFLAQALGMRVVGFDPGIAMDDALWSKRAIKPLFMAELLRTADVISLHLPRSVHSRRLLDAAALSTMKPEAVLISACAGGVVDEEALAAALRAGQLAGAALDVFDREPLPAGSPLVQCPNLLLSPHVAGRTQESRQRVARMLVDKVLKSLELEDDQAGQADKA
jgi:(S)-sulfolactate dehydrogenase